MKTLDMDALPPVGRWLCERVLDGTARSIQVAVVGVDGTVSVFCLSTHDYAESEMVEELREMDPGEMFRA